MCSPFQTCVCLPPADVHGHHRLCAGPLLHGGLHWRSAGGEHLFIVTHLIPSCFYPLCRGSLHCRRARGDCQQQWHLCSFWPSAWPGWLKAQGVPRMPARRAPCVHAASPRHRACVAAAAAARSAPRALPHAPARRRVPTRSLAGPRHHLPCAGPAVDHLLAGGESRAHDPTWPVEGQLRCLCPRSAAARQQQLRTYLPMPDGAPSPAPRAFRLPQAAACASSVLSDGLETSNMKASVAFSWISL